MRQLAVITFRCSLLLMIVFMFGGCLKPVDEGVPVPRARDDKDISRELLVAKESNKRLQTDVFDLRKRNEPLLLDMARLALQRELVAIHWQALETDSNVQGLVRRMPQDLWTTTMPGNSVRYTVRFYKTQNGTREEVESDRFAVQAMDEIATSGNDFWEIANRTVRYAQVIRLTESNCVVCHRALDPSLDVKDLDGLSPIYAVGTVAIHIPMNHDTSSP